MTRHYRRTTVFVLILVCFLVVLGIVFPAQPSSYTNENKETPIIYEQKSEPIVPDSYSVIMAYYDIRNVSESDLIKLAYEKGLTYTGSSPEFGVCFFDLIYEPEYISNADINSFCDSLDEDSRLKNAFINPYFTFRTQLESTTSDSDVLVINTDYIFGTDSTPDIGTVKECLSKNSTRYYIDAKKASLYLLPTTTAPILNTLYGNNIVYAMPLNDTWSYMIYDDVLCYIENQYLSLQMVPGYNFSIIGNFSEDRVAYANKYISYIPDAVWKEFQRRNWTLIITTKDVRNTYSPNHPVKGSFAGLTMFSRKKCAIGDSEKRLRRALIHEIGHFADYCKGYPSKGKAFKKIYREERSKVKFVERVDNHCTSSSIEYFAESFAHYLIHPDVLKNSAPKTYAYFDSFVNNF